MNSSFENNKNERVTIRLQNSFNLVGLTQWQAGFYLAEYLLENKSIIDNKISLELGAGTGLTSILLNIHNKPSHIIITDYAPQIIENIKLNCEISN